MAPNVSSVMVHALPVAILEILGVSSVILGIIIMTLLVLVFQFVLLIIGKIQVTIQLLCVRLAMQLAVLAMDLMLVIARHVTQDTFLTTQTHKSSAQRFVTELNMVKLRLIPANLVMLTA